MNLSLINKIIDNPTSPINETLSASRKIKKQLFDIFKSRPVFALSRPRKDILQILDKVRNLASQQRQNIDKKEQILFDFKNEETFAQTSDLLSTPISNSTKNWNWC